MGFLSSVNGGGTGTGGTSPTGSSRFLGGIRETDEKEQKNDRLRAEAEQAAAEAKRANSPMTIAKETLFGIPKVLQSAGKAVLDDPMKTLATPVIRAEQAAFTALGRATGNENLERAANQPMTLPSMLGGQGGTIEPQRGWDEGGAKQIAGDTAKYAATIYTGGRVAPVVGTARSGLIRQAGVQGAKEGAIATGGYMGGDELQRQDSTVGSVVKETGKGLALGGFLGGVLSGGGAAIARPGVQARTLRPLPVEDLNPTPGTQAFRYENPNAPYDTDSRFFAANRGDAEEFSGDGKQFVSPYIDESRLYKGVSSEQFLEKEGLMTPELRQRLDAILDGDDGGDPNLYYKLTQDAAEKELRSRGYAGAKWSWEDDLTPEQFQIWDRSVQSDTPTPQPNIRRIKNLPVEDLNGRARNVPINRAQEPHLTEAEMPTIQMGPAARSSLPEIQFAAPKSRATGDITYEPVRTAPNPETSTARTRPGDVPRVPKPSRTEASAPTRGNIQPAKKPTTQEDVATRTGRPVTMDIPKRTASVDVNKPKPGQTTTVSKAASDANRKLAEQGFDAVPEEELARIGSINKADQLDKVARLMDDPRVKDMAAGTHPVPDGVAPQVLFNAVKNRAVKEGDVDTLQRLARSKIASERSTAAQTLGSSGFNNDPVDVLRAMDDVEKARSGAAERRRQPSDVKKEAKTAESFIKKARATQTWDQVVDSLTC